MMSKQKVLFTISALAMSALVFSGCTSVANGSGTQGNVGGTAPASSATAPIASPSGNVSAGIAGNATADSQYITCLLYTSRCV